MHSDSMEQEKEMVKIKTEVMTLRVRPTVKAAVKVLADREKRSVANMIEVLIHEHCVRVGLCHELEPELINVE